MTRPLPWHDTPKCRELVASRVTGELCYVACHGPIMVSFEGPVFSRCAACGTQFVATHDEQRRIDRASAAWDLVLAGKVHDDKACARCGGVLPIERERLCPACVTADMDERQGVLL